MTKQITEQANANTSNNQNLVAEHLPLTGKHLIEASAGTGKTYNITRIYLRLLLEQEFTVDQILVMTFTKDATEEIRGRIAQTLRDSLANWDTLCNEDPFYQCISERIAKRLALALIKKALLFMDEASIFTLHGFCKRVLSEYAFNSGLSFSLDMETSGQALYLQACQDWYRYLSKQAPDSFTLVSEFWAEPTSFVSTFSGLFSSDKQIYIADANSIMANYQQLISQALNDLMSHHDLLVTALVDVKKGKDKEVREQELAALKLWLENQKASAQPLTEAFAGAFIDKRRYSRSKFKAELLAALENVYQAKDFSQGINNKLRQASAYVCAKQGVEHIKQKVIELKQQENCLTFDDLISLLAAKLTAKDANDEQAIALANKLRASFPVAMVDEFQDTDPQQFNILKALYPNTVSNTAINNTNNGLFLIGDPKQAIYGFRGGDIFTYLSARNYCQYQWVMDTNWRSTPEMITGYNRLFYGHSLNEEQGKNVFGFNIQYQAVNASPKKIAQGYQYPEDKALSFVYFEQDEPQKAVKQSFRSQMTDWCSDKIQQLLASKECESKDIAILVRDGTEANEMKNSLASIGIASVYLSNKTSLWQSETAQQLARLLNAILFNENDRLYIAGLASGLMPYDLPRLQQLQSDELAWQSLKYEMQSHKDTWQKRGFITMAIALLHNHIKVKPEDKDRTLTNLLHLFELLQQASERYKQPQELLYWFDQQLNLDIAESDAELRLESDESLIKIVTQHGSKGLEYPVVFVPFACRYKDPTKAGLRKKVVIDYHDQSGKPVVALGDDKQAFSAMVDESFAETIRLLYVAVTRAEKQCYLLVANFENVDKSPLGLTLGWQASIDIENNLTALAAEYPEAIALTKVAADYALDTNHPNNKQEKTATPNVPNFNGQIERDWWLSSFTALSRNLRHGGVSLPDRDQDDLTNEETVNSGNIRFNLEKGATAGNLLHDIFEHAELAELTLENSKEILEPYFQKYADILAPWTPAELANWLLDIIAADLGHGFSFSDIAADKTLKESEFYFPMEQASASQLSIFLTQLRRAVNPNTAPVYLPNYQHLKGMMHGFIDLVFEHDGKYYVADYKSSYLGDSFTDYNQQALQANVEKNYYDLQYCIYALALHRQLKVVLPDYDPEQHFGGVFYFYLRGMSANAAADSTMPDNNNSGIYFYKMPTEQLSKLDAIFSGGKEEESNDD